MERITRSVAGGNATPITNHTQIFTGGTQMPSWKCSNCGYTFDAETHPNECPSCHEKCEFLDHSCYTPDCAAQGTDDRIAGPKK
jgi:rubredoxin